MHGLRSPTGRSSILRKGTLHAQRNDWGAHMVNDRCDECGAQAYVTTILDTGLHLTWCAHDFSKREESLAAYTVNLIDTRHLLNT